MNKKAFRSKKYLDWIKTQSCCVCRSPESEPHHLISVGLGGTMGGKEDDSLVIPLCRRCHNQVHSGINSIDQPYYFMQTIKGAFREGVLGYV